MTDINNIYLPGNYTIDDITLSLKTLDILESNQLKHVAIESISNDPVYMAMGFIASRDSCGQLSEIHTVFEEYLNEYQQSPWENVIMSPWAKACNLLWENNICQDLSDACFEESFHFSIFKNKIPGIEHTFKNTDINKTRLELYNKNNLIYGYSMEWVNTAQGVKIKDFSFMDFNRPDRYAELPTTYLNSTDIKEFKQLLSSVGFKIEHAGKYWLNRWLLEEVNGFNPPNTIHTDKLAAICNLLDLDVVRVQAQLNMFKNLDVLSTSSISNYATILYEVGKDSFDPVELPPTFDCNT